MQCTRTCTRRTYGTYKYTQVIIQYSRREMNIFTLYDQLLQPKVKSLHVHVHERAIKIRVQAILREMYASKTPHIPVRVLVLSANAP